MTLYELGDVHRITTGAIGEPGERVFFLQVDADAATYAITVEKQQVLLLASSVRELLATVGLSTMERDDDEGMELRLPVDPLWRAGRLSLGYDEPRDRFVLEIEEMVVEDEDEDAEPEEPDLVRLSATREMMLALAVHGEEVASRGRPTCQYCGNPIDPDGHVCPAMNGHSKDH
ncbi:MAG: DUF3090 family protein [Actinomycetota bacterium]